MSILVVGLLVVALVLLVLAGLLVKVPRVNLMAIGLAVWELAELIMREHLQ
jgi:hypothetical protein